MLFCACFVQEQAGGFNHHVSANVAPLQCGRVTLLGEANFFAIDDQRIAFNRNLALEAAMHRVVLKHVGQVLRLQQIVDADDLNIAKTLHG